MDEWQTKYDTPLGTGYANCPTTVSFLRQSLDKGSYELPVTRVINKAAQKVTHLFWQEGGKVPIPAKHLVGQTFGHGDINATPFSVYNDRRQLFFNLRDKLRNGEMLSAEEAKLFVSIDSRRARSSSNEDISAEDLEKALEE